MQLTGITVGFHGVTVSGHEYAAVRAYDRAGGWLHHPLDFGRFLTDLWRRAWT